MKRTQLKDALRNIWKQKVSYISIVVIAFLGVTSFLGISYSAAALKRNGSAFYNEANFRDIEIVATLLMTEDDMRAILGTEGVADAEAVWQTSAKVSAGQTRKNASVITLTERINLPQLVEGRLPESAGECAVEQRLAEEMGWNVGDRIELLSSAGDTAPYLLGGSYEITGIADHPDHTCLNVPDTMYVLVTQEAFDKEALDDCFMKAEIMIEKAADADRFGEAYETAVAAVSARLEELSVSLVPLRDEQVHDKYQSEIDDGQAQLDEGWTELQDARAELDEGWTALEDGERELAEGEERLSEGKTQLEKAWEQLLDARKKLEAAAAELSEAKAELDSGNAELSYGEARLDSARAELVNVWKELEDAKESIRGALRAVVEEAYGDDTSGLIQWASRMDVNPDSYGATAMDFWITDSFKLDLDLSLSENITNFILSDEIPDEVLIAAYENLAGGGV